MAAPPPLPDFDDIPKYVRNDRVGRTLNPVWLRMFTEMARQQDPTMDESHAEYAARAVPIAALNTGTEMLRDTTKRAFFTRCTCANPAPGCLKETYATNLMPVTVQRNGQLYTEELCVHCWNQDQNL